MPPEGLLLSIRHLFRTFLAGAREGLYMKIVVLPAARSALARSELMAVGASGSKTLARVIFARSRNRWLTLAARPCRQLTHSPQPADDEGTKIFEPCAWRGTQSADPAHSACGPILTARI